jgi:NADH-quinone oxidoreductase subunit G
MQIMVVQTAPAVRVAIGEEAGLAPGSITTGQMVAGLKKLGFDYVFDTGGGQHCCCVYT